MQKEFHDIVSIKEAKEMLMHHYKIKRKIQEIKLADALGRVLADDVIAEIDIPPFDRAVMDGYAVIAKDTFYADEENPVTLNLIGSIRAGDAPGISLKTRECARIATGAVIPKGANAVVMVEYTDESKDAVKVYGPVVPGENIMAAGSDIMMGETIIRKGTFLTSRETGVLAALGVEKIKVYKKPRVGVISTGNEIKTIGEKLDYGKIYDVNSRALADCVKESGGEAFPLGVIKDEYNELYNKFREVLNEDYDIILASGGTSAGVGDMLYRIIDELGEPGILVHGVAVKPGKPLIIGVVNEKPIFGLPGYPVSAIITFEVFVEGLIRELAGLRSGERRMIKARTSVRLYSSSGKHEYMPVNLVLASDGSYSLYPVMTGSGAITTLAGADGYIEIPEGTEIVPENKDTDVILISQMLSPADLTIIGSHCIGIDVILGILSEKFHMQTKVINVGSTGGLAAVKRGEADISGTHLLDEKGEYNIRFFRDLDLRSAVLVRGYDREQGLIVSGGNPKKILSVGDILNPDVSFINRDPGSGTRILLDIELAKLGDVKEISKKINGYEILAKTHSAVASAVAYGKADVGFGIKTVADQYNLDFIPLKEEKYDFAIPKNKLEKAEVQRFLEVLRSGEFKNKLKELSGLKTNSETGKIIFEC
ncbi:MAG: molybdopterin biosynthesis protein [Candidatus Altiarchaeales archaeon WOR_SM1_86-2]|nr:MAG: molybdopterin biosynthesis protein [Candidatus Altiarchaeales archaeon WOR_SM1_86-2]ODS41320.1 MAG: molybdopterin biosynthesis protein [Candidatus Altiarchaeales archaeon WOR_SM1_79]